MTTAPEGSIEATPLVVRTVPVDDPGRLLALLPPEDTVAWVRRGDGLVGWGTAAAIRTKGADRFADARGWWTEMSQAAVVRDEVKQPGTGLVSFGSFAFADEPGDSILVIPEVVVGRRGDTTWVTTIGLAGIMFCAGLTLVLSPFAWVMGRKAVREIDENPGAYSGRDQARGGQIMGIIGTVLLVLGLVALVILIVLAAAVWDSGSGMGTSTTY